MGRPQRPISRDDGVTVSDQAALYTDHPCPPASTPTCCGSSSRSPTCSSASCCASLGFGQPRRLRAAVAGPGDPQPLPGGGARRATPPTGARWRCPPSSRTAAGRCCSAAASTACAASPTASLVVEEIKSVRRGGQLSPATREIYERQALLYAWMLRLTEERAGARRAGAHRDRQRRGRARSAADVVGRARGRGPAAPDRPAAAATRRERAAREERRRVAAHARLPLRRSCGRARSSIVAAVEHALEQPRAPAARGAHRPRQDGGRALPGAALRARQRQAGLRAHRQDAAAGHGDQGAARCSTATSAFRSLRLRAKAQDVRQRRGDLPRGVLPLRARLLRQAETRRHRAAPARRARRRSSPTTSSTARRADEVCPFEVSPRPRAPGAGGGLRLQLRLRPLRRALRVRRRRRPLRRRSW